MYFAVVKLVFEDSGESGGDRKELRSLVEKLRARFKITVASLEGHDLGIAIATLASSEERLTQTLDGITDFCENSGFGRIASEQTLFDHIDCLEDLAADAEAGDDED